MKNCLFNSVLFLVVMLVYMGQARATISPTDVFQKTEILALKLEALGLLKHIEQDMVDPTNMLRHPRHVIQKVRECHTLVGKILIQKGYNPEKLPDLFSVQEIRPIDVLSGVNHLIMEVDKLSPPEIVIPTITDQKVPGDVYTNLNKICRSLDAEIVPSDLFQIALGVNERLDNILTLRAYDNSFPVKVFADIKPIDVYIETLSFLTDLRLLALNPDFAIPGGIIFRNYKPVEEDIKPQDIMSLMNDSFSGTSAISYTLGYRDRVLLPSYEDHKTFSNVYAQISRAHDVVRFLLTQETGDEQ